MQRRLMFRTLPIALLLPAAAAAQSFTTTIYPDGNGGNGIALADFNHDGNCDAITVHINSTNPATVSLLLGNGTGAVASPVPFTIGVGGAGIIVGDWNNDSNPDVATAETNGNGASGSVSVLLGNGFGSLTLSSQYAVGSSSRSIATADLNNDGLLDLVTADSNASANTITVLLNLGGGGFGVVGPTFAGSKAWSVALGDVNGDGIPDAVTANNGASTFSVLINDGTGAFPAGPIAYGTGGGPRSIALGDVDGDGLADVATANGVGNSVTLYTGVGGGAMALKSHLTVGTNPSSVTFGDVDGDGIEDIVACDQTGAVSNDVSVLLGLGGATYAAANHFPVGQFPAGVRIADMNGDGRPDLGVSHNQGGSMAILINNAGTPAGITPFGTGTPGILGTLGLNANSSPQIGNAAFRINGTSGAGNQLGLLMIADVADVGGSDPFGLGALLHVDLLASTQVYALDMKADGAGIGSTALPIPNAPALLGLSYYAQSLFVEPLGRRASISTYGVVTSRAFQLTIQP